MPTDDERREVARRLRGARYGWHSWERALYDALGVDTETAGLDMLDRLADLIEPDEPKVVCAAEVKIDGERLEKLAYDAAVELTGIDREALLALADEMERSANETMAYFANFNNRDVIEYAHRIREACGEE